MDVKEKLVELLAETPGIGWSPSAREIIADHLIANGVTVQEWISVKDRLPEEDGEYLVFEKGAYGTSARVLSFAKDARKVDKYDFHCGWKNAWYRYHSELGYITIDDVTHWMPLPQPPKELYPVANINFMLQIL